MQREPPDEQNMSANLKANNEVLDGLQKRKLGKRLPDNWAPTKELLDWAELNCPDIDVAYELDQFKDYWLGTTGKAAYKCNWVAGARSWLRKAQKQARDRSVAPMDVLETIQRQNALRMAAELAGATGVRERGPLLSMVEDDDAGDWI